MGGQQNWNLYVGHGVGANLSNYYSNNLDPARTIGHYEWESLLGQVRALEARVFALPAEFVDPGDA